MIDDDDALSAPLERAAALLRDEPRVRPEWRATVLARLEAPVVADASPLDRGQRLEGIRVRRWSMRPSVAIAAGIICAIAGAGTTLEFVNTRALSVHAESALLAAQQTSPASTAASTAASATASQVRFALVAPSAGTVTIVGDFNGWNPTSLPLQRAADGRTWEVQVPLAPGRYAYAFMVDGRISRDPVAPQGAGDDFGVSNSVVLVKGS